MPPLAIAAALVMKEISSLLRSLQVDNKQAYAADALSGWPGFLWWKHKNPVDAIDVWATAASKGGRSGLVLAWIDTHLLLDILIFAPAYVAALYLVLRRIWTVVAKLESPPFPAKWLKWLCLTVLVCDWGETILTGCLVDGLTRLPRNDAIAVAVTTFSFLKWAFFAIAVLFGGMAFARTLPLSLKRWLTRWKAGTMSGCRVWTRHRNQLGVLLLLALLAVMPGEGPLEQIPDIERSWAGSDDLMALLGNVAGPAATLVGLCLALWVAGRWALLDGVPDTREGRGRRGLLGLAALALVVAVAAVALIVTKQATPGALSVPVIVVVLAAWSFLLTVSWSGGEETSASDSARLVAPAQMRTGIPPVQLRGQVRNVGRVLAVIPLIIAGLALTRAYARPLLLGPTIATSHDRTVRLDAYTEVVVWFGVGLAAAVFAAPLAHRAIRFVEDRWLDGEEAAASLRPAEHRGSVPSSSPAAAEADTPASADASTRLPWSDNRVRLPGLLGSVLFGVAVALGAFMAWKPLVGGPLVRSLGVLLLFLTTLTLIGSWIARRSEYRLPLPVFRYLHFRLTPFWLLVVAALVLQAQLDTVGGYHEVRLKSRTGSTTVPGHGERPLDPAPPDHAPAGVFQPGSSFKDWLAAANRCLDRQPELKPANSIPMLFVAAPGGGIRAAYWTGSVMDKLTQSPCGQQMVYGISGVSGGSLGLIGHLLGQEDFRPAPNAGRVFAERLAGEDTLSANMAAWFYRDLPRALHGINKLGALHPGDRATVFERSWEGLEKDLKQDFFEVTRPYSKAEKSRWRPVTLLNGTDVNTGCRIVISSQWATGGLTDDAAPSLNCRRAEVTTVSGSGEAAMITPAFAAGAIDAAAFTDDQNCQTQTRNQGLRLSTAVHLSARFPFISPTGRMHRCIAQKSGGSQSAVDLDGGLLEGSGLAVLLELWEKLEPRVAQHNRNITNPTRRHGPSGCAPTARRAPRTACAPSQRYVLPVIAVLDNHYQSRGAAPAAERQPEAIAPIIGTRAPRTAVDVTTLEQLALLRFSGPPPGVSGSPKIEVNSLRCSHMRSFFVAPSDRPGIAAPLGWVLSDMSMKELDAQLKDLRTEENACTDPRRTRGNDSPRWQPSKLRTLLTLLTGPVHMTPSS
ncbi:hypothetical protein [Streptomyces sp. NPDC050546]|uniref:hypothetical protein n=1 Tax=Streptomyces sp. NPDC050546 TaxID=3365628 RepID=UPI0037B9271D